MKKELSALLCQADMLYFWSLLSRGGVPVIDAITLCKEEFPQYEIELETMAQRLAGEAASDGMSAALEDSTGLAYDVHQIIVDVMHMYPGSFHTIIRRTIAGGRKSETLDESMQEAANRIITSSGIHASLHYEHGSAACRFYHDAGREVEKGKSLTAAMQRAARTTGFPPQDALKRILRQRREGDSLSNALASYPELFPNYIQQLVWCAELTEPDELCVEDLGSAVHVPMWDVLLLETARYLLRREFLRGQYQSDASH